MEPERNMEAQMDEKMINNSQELEIDVQRLVNALLNKAWIIAVAAVICAVISFVGTFFLVTPGKTSSPLALQRGLLF